MRTATAVKFIIKYENRSVEFKLCNPIAHYGVKWRRASEMVLWNGRDERSYDNTRNHAQMSS